MRRTWQPLWTRPARPPRRQQRRWHSKWRRLACLCRPLHKPIRQQLLYRIWRNLLGGRVRSPVMARVRCRHGSTAHTAQYRAVFSCTVCVRWTAQTNPGNEWVALLLVQRWSSASFCFFAEVLSMACWHKWAVPVHAWAASWRNPYTECTATCHGSM